MSPAYVDYTQYGEPHYTRYARWRMGLRYITTDDVWWVLANHEIDRPGQRPERREVIGRPGLRRIMVVIEPDERPVLVVNAIPVR